MNPWEDSLQSRRKLGGGRRIEVVRLRLFHTVSRRQF